MQIQTLSVGPIGTLCYLISAEGAETCAVIDPGAEAARIRKAAGGRRIEAILLPTKSTAPPARRRVRCWS